jgi:hypothetical protein
MAAAGGNIIRYIYRGAVGEIIPFGATHIFVQARSVRAYAFEGNPTIVEVIFHVDVEDVDEYAFANCPSLRRVIMPGVKAIGREAFYRCGALEDVECDELELVAYGAFSECESLRSINLPSAKIVGLCALAGCEALTDAKFGCKLERIFYLSLKDCSSIERITIPLKNGLFTTDDIFLGCAALKHVDLVEEAELNETISALQLEEWRNDMNEEIDSINQILPSAHAGYWMISDNHLEPGEKAQVIRTWVRSVLDKIIHYKGEHQRILDVAENALQPHYLPKDILTNNVLPFLQVPSYSFEGEI